MGDPEDNGAEISGSVDPESAASKRAGPPTPRAPGPGEWVEFHGDLPPPPPARIELPPEIAALEQLDRLARQVSEIVVQMPDAAMMARTLLGLQDRLKQVEAALGHLMQQRSIADQQLRIHTRATALDLAIKAVGQQNAVVLTDTAEAFVAWLTVPSSTIQ